MTRRALLSVSDKTGLAALGQRLHALGFELIASGGTLRHLRAAALPARAVSEITGAPEILGGRVKTLHPAIHGGILARDTPEHADELAALGWGPIDLVVCNLYPFAQTVLSGARDGLELSELTVIEQIDIGGPTLLRAAAKNFERCTVACDPADYPALADALDSDRLDLELRRRMALKAFRHTARYDAAIATWLGGRVDPDGLPQTLHLTAERDAILRYGENPHQAAAAYRWADAGPRFEQLGGKALSYNNLVDLTAAWAMPAEFSQPAVAVVKHTNPCGLAVGESAVQAFERALACDPVSAFGSIVTVNRPVDGDFVRALRRLFVEVIAAPGFTEEALTLLGRRKKRCRVMRALPIEGAALGEPTGLKLRSMPGGLLVQAADDRGADTAGWTVASERPPTAAERADLAFAWLTVKHVKSNAIVLAKDGATVGIGAGQMNRVQSVDIATAQAGEKAAGSVLASDAFFPFADGLEHAAAAGVRAVIQPGGSIRDEEVIAAANRLGVAMVFTGERHFAH